MSPGPERTIKLMTKMEKYRKEYTAPEITAGYIDVESGFCNSTEGSISDYDYQTDSDW